MEAPKLSSTDDAADDDDDDNGDKRSSEAAGAAGDAAGGATGGATRLQSDSMDAYFDDSRGFGGSRASASASTTSVITPSPAAPAVDISFLLPTDLPPPRPPSPPPEEAATPSPPRLVIRRQSTLGRHLAPPEPAPTVQLEAGHYQMATETQRHYRKQSVFYNAISLAEIDREHERRWAGGGDGVATLGWRRWGGDAVVATWGGDAGWRRGLHARGVLTCPLTV